MAAATVGFASKDNMKELQRAGGHYIIGGACAVARARWFEATKRRYREVRENLRTKEVAVGDDEARCRYVLVHNPVEARPALYP